MKKVENKNEILKRINSSKDFQEAYYLLKKMPLHERKDNVYSSVINKIKTNKEMLLLLDYMKINNILINDKILRSFLIRTKCDSDVLYLLEQVDYKHNKFNKTTYREILLKLKNYKIAEEVFNNFKILTTPNIDMYNAILYKCKKFEQIIPYINEIKELDIKLNDRICSTIINKVDNFYNAILFVYDMIDQEIKVRDKIYLNLINLVSNEKELDELNVLLNNQNILNKSNEQIFESYNKKNREIKYLKQAGANIENNNIEQSFDTNIIKKINYEELKIKYDCLFKKEIERDYFYILDSNEPIQDHINFLSNEINVVNINLATGFLYKSGLEMIYSSLENALKNKGCIKLVIGSLQKYNTILKSSLGKINAMDKATAEFLNQFIINNSIKLKTIEKRFFHGKFYIFEGIEKSCVFIGSSNISASGFVGNQEFNILYILNNSSTLFKQFKQKSEEIWNSGESINELNVDKFIDLANEYDKIYTVTTIKKLKENDIYNKIESLSEEQVKKRLRMWMQRNPTNIYSNLGVKSLNGYILFEYSDYDMCVLESFEAGNSYYYFKNIKLDELVKMIKYLSKTEIFKLSSMQKRGYHIKNEASLELSIASLFVKDILNSDSSTVE